MQKKFKIKKGDTVKVIAGAALGQQGIVLDVDYTKERVFIEGLSVVNKKHVKPQSDKANPDGGIIDKDMPIHLSNLLFYDPEQKKGVKIGFKLNNSKKIRINKSSGKEI